MRALPRLTGCHRDRGQQPASDVRASHCPCGTKCENSGHTKARSRNVSRPIKAGRSDSKARFEEWLAGERERPQVRRKASA